MGGGGRSPSSSSSSLSKPKTLDLQWVPLQHHPVFRTTRGSGAAPLGNLAAWDAASSRLYLWDPNSRRLHRLSIRFSDDVQEVRDDGDSGSFSSTSPSLILAASPSEILVPVSPIRSSIHQISLNADGSSVLLSGRYGLWLMNLYERISSSSSSSGSNTISYRTSNVGSQIFSAHDNGLQILHVSWHPYSNSHVGILSSDSVLRLFDLSSDLERPEQEFYLQPFELGSCHNAVCPVAFSFGGQHLWDRFSIFVLFSDGSTFVLCPVIPFGSLCSWTVIEELHEDVKAFGLKSTNTNVISNLNLSLDWLESTFPELAGQSLEKGSEVVLRAHPYAPLDASLTLQGPLSKVRSGEENDDSKLWSVDYERKTESLSKVRSSEEKDGSRLWSADYEGKAVSFLYSSIGKDSVLVIGWSSGQLQIDALADEVQPLWNIGSSPRLRADSYGRVKGVAMICESNLQESSAKLSHPSLNISDTEETVWLGAPLLRLATVDLALPRNSLDNCFLALFPDPLLAERFYCLHGAGVDLISLHFLPFSNLLDETDKIERAPSVFPILTTCHGESCSTSSLCGFAAIADTCGHSQLVGITPSYECIVLESKYWTEATPIHYSMDVQSAGYSDTADSHDVISKELLSGPKAIVVPPLTNLRSLTADSIEGRSTLHQYIKLFHENYAEYAHKVFVELEHHEDYLKMIIDNQHKRLDDTKQLLLNVEGKKQGIKDRISRAFKVYDLLEQRLQNFRMLPGANKKPLSRAEREFKTQLETFAEVELDAVCSSIEALNARARRSHQSNPVNTLSIKGQPPGRRKNKVSDGQMQKIRSSMELLSIINSENTKKINLIEQGLKSQEE